MPCSPAAAARRTAWCSSPLSPLTHASPAPSRGPCGRGHGMSPVVGGEDDGPMASARPQRLRGGTRRRPAPPLSRLRSSAGALVRGRTPAAGTPSPATRADTPAVTPAVTRAVESPTGCHHPRAEERGPSRRRRRQARGEPPGGAGGECVRHGTRASNVPRGQEPTGRGAPAEGPAGKTDAPPWGGDASVGSVATRECCSGGPGSSRPGPEGGGRTPTGGRRCTTLPALRAILCRCRHKGIPHRSGVGRDRLGRGREPLERRRAEALRCPGRGPEQVEPDGALADGHQ